MLNINDQCWADCSDEFYLAFADVSNNLESLIHSPIDVFHDLYSAYCAK